MPHRLGQREAVLSGRRFGAANSSSMRRSRSRSTSTQRPRIIASPSVAASSFLDFLRRQPLAVERDFDIEIEQRFHAEHRRRLAADSRIHRADAADGALATAPACG